MGDFLSKISGQFTSALLMSASFPVLLFLIVFALVVLPITPHGHDITDAVQNPKYWQDHPVVALVLTGGVLMLSVVLYNLNTSIIRLYEGYPWKDALIGQWFTRRQEQRYGAARTVRQRINRLYRVARLYREPCQDGSQAADAELEVDADDLPDLQPRLGRAVNGSYPSRRDLLLPTRLGNTIRAFETYPSNQYGLDAVTVWPRLQAVVDGNLTQLLDGAKTALDFMIHCSFLSALLAILSAASGLYWATNSWDKVLPWAAWVVVLATISYLFYLASISRAYEWGTQVKTAFDLHRLTLLSKLGYERKPADLDDERRIWNNVNYNLEFPDERVTPILPYLASASTVITEPPDIVIEITRKNKINKDHTQVTVRVQNIDPAGETADRVVLCEQIPSGMVCVSGVKVDGTPATLRSTQPLTIDIGELAYGHARMIVYRFQKALP